MGHQPLKTQSLKLKTQNHNLKLKAFLLLSFSFAFCILSFKFSYAQTTFDPLVIGVGARSLGMGRASTALADDCNVIFNNPAGLGEIDYLNFTSMAASVLEEVNYTLLGGIYPLGKQSAFGIGYTGGFVSGIEMRDAAGAFSRRANFGSNVIIASFGRKLFKKTSLGANLKYYFTDGTEDDSGDGHGLNVDIGLLQSDLGFLTLGVVGQNVLSGSTIRYQNGASASLPLTLKAGACLELLGSSYRAAVLSPAHLILSVDVGIDFQKPKTLALFSGAEFSPLPYLSLRAGWDQSVLTLGSSLKLAGLGFHYAYHPQAQFFSLSFDERGWPPEIPHDTAVSCKNSSSMLK